MENSSNRLGNSVGPGFRGCFVTATDTDVGKTVVAAGLLRALRGRGVEATAVKPVQTGCELGALAPDVLCYRQACADSPEMAVPPFAIQKFRIPCSPHLATRLEQGRIDMDELLARIRGVQGQGVFTVVEGAGGLLVPLGDGRTMLDLAQALDLPVILVVANRLGAINHALLSLQALRQRGLDVLGVVMNRVTDGSDDEAARAILADTPKAIAEYGQAEVLAELPFTRGLRAEDAGRRVAAWEQVEAALAGVAAWLVEAQNANACRDESLLDFDREQIWHPYTSATRPLRAYEADRTGGPYIRLRDGRRLLDGMASWWCAIHGYNHSHLSAAAHRQIEHMPHVMFGGLTHEPAVSLARKLLDMAPEPMRHVFFADSGSVSVEAAIKMAMQYWQARGRKQRTRLLTVRGGYHGDTFGAMSVCDPQNGMHSLYTGMLPKHVFVERPSCRFDEEFDEGSLAAMRDALARHADELAAVILEPIVQGAGGMWFYHPDYLRGVRRLCDEHGVLLILDEIATGFGRTGKMFAGEWADVSPDIMCVGKALTGGYMTLAAVLASAEVAQGISADGGVFMHGPTFMANPLACAVANASLELLEQGQWRGQVADIEGWLRTGLAPCRDCADVADVRVLGAIGVLEMKRPVNVPALQAFFVEQGVWIRPFSNLIYVMPPYILMQEQVGRLTRVMHSAVREKRHF
ncbi:adenosylmethionine--8-amino-7-oxononanoate transaminase [Desulfocurvibacter africanus]|uniref:adenosylmethionine--8-amino-7-oxononanoate transaminase n=1 Tax=Desulfocurvibacter africanus TaxID=873 RepID=UPI000424A4AA|nr:adenosylmethionine--8-amino-7-oxononanoate transaminase [Desulfocurvibacter africanus]